MAQPTAYNRLIDFTDYQTAHPDDPFQGSYLDAELDAIETTLDGVLANLALIQRDDGALFNGCVTPDSLSTATKALIAGDWTPRGDWVTATAYVVGDVVENSDTSYVCATAHTSGTFATDKAAGYWTVLGSYISGGASSIAFTPTGTIAATNVQTAIQEVAAESMLIANSLSDVASVVNARANLEVPSWSEIQLQTYTAATAGGTADAITASFTPAITSLTDKLRVSVSASGANTSSTPTFTPNSGVVTAKRIVKGANTALVVGDIAGSDAVMDLQYDASLDRWILLNPATAPNAVSTGGATFTGDVIFDTGTQLILDNSITAAGANLPLCFDGDENTGFFRPAADTLAAATGGTERWRIDSAGNFGVARTPYAWTVFTSVFDFPAAAIAHYSASTDRQLRLMANLYYDGSYKYRYATDGASMFYLKNDTFYWDVAAGGSADAAAAIVSAATMSSKSSGGGAATGYSYTHLHGGATGVSVNNGQALVCAMGGGYAAVVILEDQSSGNSAVLHITGGGSTVRVMDDPAPITGAGKWVVTASVGTIIATNNWGGARSGNMFVISGS